MYFEDFFATLKIGAINADLTVETTGSHQNMPFDNPESGIFKVPPLVVHSVPQFNVLTDSRLLLSARLTPQKTLLPPQDTLRPLLNQICLGLLTGAALLKQPCHAT